MSVIASIETASAAADQASDGLGKTLIPSQWGSAARHLLTPSSKCRLRIQEPEHDERQKHRARGASGSHGNPTV
jgi:hypothetical protein